MGNAVVDLAEFTTLVPIKALGPDHSRELARQSEVCTFAKGEYIFKQGQAIEHIIYVLKGEVVLYVDEAAVRLVQGGSKAAKLPLAQGKVYIQSARAKTDVECVKVDPDTLDIMLTWDQSGGYEVQEIDKAADETANDGDWMSKLLQAKVFTRIPPGNIQLVFMRMETHHFAAGETVITQGDEGEHFYIIREGRCRVTRKTRKNPEGIVLATLGPGDNFGEESLISGGKRNASIIMVTDGVLMSLSKTDFLELLNEPLLKWISYNDAKAQATEGAIWIDVRLPAEHQAKHIAKSVNIPLPLLRAKVEKLDPQRTYLVYCDSGRRSSIAAYLLSQHGIESFVLQDALDSLPASELV